MSTLFDEESLKLLESINLCHKIDNVSKKISKKSLAIRQFPINCGRNVSNIINNSGLEIASSSIVQNVDDRQIPTQIIGNEREIETGHQQVVAKPMQDQRVNAISFIDSEPQEAIPFHDRQRPKVSELLESQCLEGTTLLDVKNSKAILPSLDDQNYMNCPFEVKKDVNNEENFNVVKTKLIAEKDEKEVDISKETQKNTEGKKLSTGKRKKHPLIEKKLHVKRDFIPLKRCSFSEDARRTLDKCQTFNKIEKKGDARQTVGTPARGWDDGCQPNAESKDSNDEKILDKSLPSLEVVNPHCASNPGNKIVTRRVFAIRSFPVGVGKNQNASFQEAECQLTEKFDAEEVIVDSSKENKDEAREENKDEAHEENKDEAQFQDMTTKEDVWCSSHNEEVHSIQPESLSATVDHKSISVFNNDTAQSSKQESQPISKMELEEIGDVKGRKRKKEDHFEIVALKKGKYGFLVSNDNAVPIDEEVDARTKVMETLSSFRSIYDLLPQKGNLIQANHQLALKLFKERNGGSISNQRFIGNVPGVEIGDEFRLRVEMFIIGLHHQHQAGIDYIKHNGKDVAISIVSSGRYSNERSNPNVLLYSGSGVSYEDQKLKRGNLALKNSIEAQIPVRVVHGVTKYHHKRGKIYIYDGLYLAEKYWTRKSDKGHFVLMFQLLRIPGQPEITMGRKQQSSTLFPLNDVSNGEEDIPIRIVNTVNRDTPMPFRYITKVIHPSSYISTLPNGCNCAYGCSDSKKCACAVKNGGKIPFNSSGAIMKAKPLVYECGPSCKCPPTCHNRVSQHGIKFQLEIFKTQTRGWGVRSPSFITSGSFVCEYVGEILMDEVAQTRTIDEYLFAIGSNYHEKALWKGLSKTIPSLKKGVSSELLDAGFAVDAFKYGNVGRFINHSCTPNLYAQNVLNDHDDIRMPHIMLFASEDIQPFEELTYDYNYAIDHVHDSSGNVKKKECYCGSRECTGWLY